MTPVLGGACVAHGVSNLLFPWPVPLAIRLGSACFPLRVLSPTATTTRRSARSKEIENELRQVSHERSRKRHRRTAL